MSPFKFGFSECSAILQSATPCLEDHFEIGVVLGKGHFGAVKACVNKRSGERLACKTICKAKLKTWEEREDVRREVAIMGLLGRHPNIISLRGAYEDDDSIHLTMDCCEGGELFDEISNEGPLSERHAAQALHGVTNALIHCHDVGILHRDLKPENILLVQKPDRQRRLEVKLADFGLSVKLKDGELTTGLAGSPYYLAPEVLSGSYGHPADIWSLGVVLYMMLSETAPFYGDTEKEILDSIRKAELRFFGESWGEISEDAKDLVKKMLQRDPNRRPTAEEVLRHRWVLRHSGETVPSSPVPNHIPRSSSSTPPRPQATAAAMPPATPELSSVHPYQTLPRVCSRASQLLTWLSPQLGGMSGDKSDPAQSQGLDSMPLMHQFSEALSDLEDGVHYFVLEETSDVKTGSTGVRLQLAFSGDDLDKTGEERRQETGDFSSVPCRQESAVQTYEPTPADALDWIFGI